MRNIQTVDFCLSFDLGWGYSQNNCENKKKNPGDQSNYIWTYIIWNFKIAQLNTWTILNNILGLNEHNILYYETGDTLQREESKGHDLVSLHQHYQSVCV